MRLGALKWNYYALQIGNFWIRSEYGIGWMLNPDIFFSGDVTRSSPVLYHEYCIQDGNRVPKFSLVLLTLPLPVFTTHALSPIFPEESWALEWIRIRVEGQIRFENGYVWTWKFLNPERSSCGFILYPDTCGGGVNERLNGLPSSEPLLSGIQADGQAPRRAYSSQVHRSMQSVQMILTLKRGQKGWRQLFSETLQRTVFTNNEGSLLCFMCFILPHLVLLKLARELAS